MSKVSKRVAVNITEEIAIAIAYLTEKYGIAEAAAVRMLIVEGIESMKDAGRL